MNETYSKKLGMPLDFRWEPCVIYQPRFCLLVETGGKGKRMDLIKQVVGLVLLGGDRPPC